MKILHIAAEVAPFVSVGGLSQVMYFLPRALRARGHDVRIFTPRYGAMTYDASMEEELCRLDVPIHDTPSITTRGGAPQSENDYLATALEYGGASAPGVVSRITANARPRKKTTIPCSLSFFHNKKERLFTYFLANKEYFELRSNVFGYADDHVRFALFSKACLEWLALCARQKSSERAWWPDLIHCHDWHASYFIEYARRNQRYHALLKTPIVLTVHNFRYQGNRDFRNVSEHDRDSGHTQLPPLTSKQLINKNPLKRGLLFADAVTTVSPTHAREILDHQYAEGLDDVIPALSKKFTGILNGIDTTEFNPETDPWIKKTYTRKTAPYARIINKKDLQHTFGLPVNPKAVLVAFVGRLVTQKGVELLLEAFPRILEERPALQLIVLGGGEERFRKNCESLKQLFPQQVGLHLEADFRLPRKIFAGADCMVFPSTFEPCGITTLEALRYGAVPIVRRTGGLNDSITDFNPETKSGNGISFHKTTSWALYGALIEMLFLYRQKDLWRALVDNCLASDFSWEYAAKDYEKWYKKTISH
ncbi:MAG: glycogen/starch synthase [Candidatus Uhrbacteria bacterium]|nr:glycogen/starch synthase [Candidatus Uhrbacteria bacterium]